MSTTSKHVSRLAALTAASLLGSALFIAPTSFAAPPPAQAQQHDPLPAEPSATTTSEVGLLPVRAAADYTNGTAVPENTGDAQQSELLRRTEQTQAQEATAGAARVDLASDVVILGVAWDDSASPPQRIDVRTLAGGEWSAWSTLEAEDGETATEPMAITNAEAVEAIAYYAEGFASHQESLELVVIDPRGEAAVENSLAPGLAETRSETIDVSSGLSTQGPTAVDTGAEFGLNIGTRRAWGANESIRQDIDAPRDHEVTYYGAVVHHTASGGSAYTQAQVPSLIQGFYSYHVSLGWGDIGYQLLVDRFGGVWEGRNGSLERTLLGSHAYGGNLHTFGISVIGEFTNAPPSEAAQDSTARAIAWMFDRYGITDPHGSLWVPGGDMCGSGGCVIPTISGHRDLNSTACPGNSFYALLPKMRDRVKALTPTALSQNFFRNAGADRYATAASTAAASYPSGTETVYIASGEDFPDALAGGPAASLAGAPMLLTRAASLPQPTSDALTALKPKTVVILGGTGVVSTAVQNRIAQLTGARITRHDGANRYETAANVSLARFAGAKTVYIASGEDFPDALAGVPIAAREQAPLMLTRPTALPPATERAIKELKPSKVVLLGGSGAVSASVENRIRALTGATIVRHAGSNRFDTTKLTALSQYGDGAETVYVATASEFPDALAGGTAAGASDAPLLLVHPNSIPADTRAALERLNPDRIIVLGGAAAVWPSVARQLDKYTYAPSA